MTRQRRRPQRVANLIKRELASQVRRLGDQDQLGMVSVTAVDVSPDLKQAKVYVTVMAAQVTTDEVVALLNTHGGELRYRLAHRLRLRSIPRLRFFYDESVESGAELSALIDSLTGSNVSRGAR